MSFPDTSKLVERLLTSIRVRYHIIKRILHENVGIPMSSLYRRFVIWCSTVCICQSDDATGSDSAPGVTPLSPSACQIELTLSQDSSNTPRSPTSIYVENVHTPDSRGDSSVRFHDSMSVGSEEKIQEFERELSSTSLMKISRSNSISSIIREDYVETNVPSSASQ